MNQKNSLGLNKSFKDEDNPISLFKIWFEEAKKSELNDPNALYLGTSDNRGKPSVRTVLLKDFDNHGFVFYTNLNSAKSNAIKDNPIVSMCFHWKSLSRQEKEIIYVARIETHFIKALQVVQDYEYIRFSI